ncbi:MAG: PAN domain-containing protein [Burkholderiales bacterium]|nr:PAN domain-containing protein [Burkholderiales bacterium]
MKRTSPAGLLVRRHWVRTALISAIRTTRSSAFFGTFIALPLLLAAVPAVPEPQTRGLLLGRLGLPGYKARRRGNTGDCSGFAPGAGADGGTDEELARNRSGSSQATTSRPARGCSKWLMAAAALLVAAPAMAGTGIRKDAHGIDRPGGDFQRSLLAQADPDLCVRQCLFDQRCASYTYVRPGVQNEKAVCYLKSSRRPVVRNKCCESGVKIGVPDPKRPTRPARIEPPPSPNKEFCALPGLICADGNKGRWNNESNSCDCPSP